VSDESNRGGTAAGSDGGNGISADAARERVPNRELLIYALGSIGGSFSWSVNMLTNPIFNMELHVSLVWLGFVLAANRVLDAITDLLIGYWSDHLHTRWGRRRPLIFVGGLGVGLLFALMWLFPSNLSQTGYLIWYGVISVFYYLGTTLFGTGYWALGIELTSGYNERTRVSAWRSYAGAFAGLTTPWFLWFIHNKRFFDNPIEGVHWLGVIVGTVMVATTLPVALFCKERFAKIEARKKTHISFGRAMTVMFRNKEWMRMTGVGLLLMATLVLFEQFSMYVNFFYVFGGDKEKATFVGGVVGNVGTVCGLLAIPLVQALSTRLGKHVAVRLCLAWMMIGTAMKWWCYTPEHPWLQLIIPFFYSIGIAAFYTITPSMTADIVDVDELITGERREAMFSAVGNLIGKIANAGATALTGFVMAATGFVVELEGKQSPETFTKMRLMYSIIPACVLLTALALVWGYSLTESRVTQIQAELRTRRAGAAGGGPAA